MLWGIVAVWVLVMIPGAYFMLERTVAELFGGAIVTHRRVRLADARHRGPERTP